LLSCPLLGLLYFIVVTFFLLHERVETTERKITSGSKAQKFTNDKKITPKGKSIN
jgi:hypothetical protein